MNNTIRLFRILCHFSPLHGNNYAVKIIDLPEHLSVSLEYLVRPGSLVKSLHRSFGFRNAHLSRFIELNEDLALDIGVAKVLLTYFDLLE